MSIDEIIAEIRAAKGRMSIAFTDEAASKLVALADAYEEGVRACQMWQENSGLLIKERDEAVSMLASKMLGETPTLYKKLEQERDALRAENERMEKDRDEWKESSNKITSMWQEVTAERDRLKAENEQLKRIALSWIRCSIEINKKLDALGFPR